MKKEEVPQDIETYRERDAMKKVMYATDEKGQYTTVASSGWEPEFIATKIAWEEVEKALQESKEAIAAGLASPIDYFMKKNQMEVGLLADNVGKWQWQVRRHLKPSGFAKLSAQTIQKYAVVFNCPTEALTHFDPEKY